MSEAVARWPESDALLGLPDSECQARLAAAETEPNLAAALTQLDGLTPTDFPDHDKVRLLKLYARLEAQLAGAKLAAVAGVAGPEPTAEDDELTDSSDCEVAAALCLSTRTAGAVVTDARWLAVYLPTTMAALAAGRIGMVQARIIAEHTMLLPLDHVERVEHLALAKAPGASPGRLRAAVRRIVARVDPDGLAEQEAAARKDTDLWVSAASDGTATLTGVNIPLADAAILDRAVDSFARSAKAGGDERTLGQLRVAALAEWASAYLTGPQAPTNHGRPVTVQVTMDLQTVLGLTDHAAEVAGGGMIPADVARALLRDATLRRLVTDPLSGHLLDYGQDTYRVPADLAAAVAARYVFTTGPGSCGLAQTSDLDHDRTWADGGTTSYDNLHPPGRRWHNAKTRGGWRTRILPGGWIEWTSRLGHRYRTDPHDYRLGP